MREEGRRKAGAFNELEAAVDYSALERLLRKRLMCKVAEANAKRLWHDFAFACGQMPVGAREHMISPFCKVDDR